MATPGARVVLYPNEIDRILRMPGGPPGVRIRRFCLDVTATARRQAQAELGRRSKYDQPRTGKYAKSFTVTVEPNAISGYQFVIANKVPYASVLESGSTGPYEIRARRKKYLRFRSRKDGQWRRVKAVMHPGVKDGYHILESALKRVLRRDNAGI